MSKEHNLIGGGKAVVDSDNKLVKYTNVNGKVWVKGKGWIK